MGVSRELIAPEYVLCTGVRRTNCLRCSSLLVMNFFVRIVTAPSDMVAPKDLQPKGGHVGRQVDGGAVSDGQRLLHWAARLSAAQIHVVSRQGAKDEPPGAVEGRTVRRPRKNVSRRNKRPGLPSPPSCKTDEPKR